MNDFSQIFEAWERRRDRSAPEAKEPHDRESTPAPPSRSEMERARIDDQIDLHGLTQDEARQTLRCFLRDAWAEGDRKVLVIHGKGLHSEGGRSVVKEAVVGVLSKDRHVAAWGEADRREGGKGASWVWLSARGK